MFVSGVVVTATGGATLVGGVWALALTLPDSLWRDDAVDRNAGQEQFAVAAIASGLVVAVAVGLPLLLIGRQKVPADVPGLARSVAAGKVRPWGFTWRF